MIHLTLAKVLAQATNAAGDLSGAGHRIIHESRHPQCYEHEHPGELIRVDIKKLEHILYGGGHLALRPGARQEEP